MSCKLIATVAKKLSLWEMVFIFVNHIIAINMDRRAVKEQTSIFSIGIFKEEIGNA